MLRVNDVHVPDMIEDMINGRIRSLSMRINSSPGIETRAMTSADGSEARAANPITIPRTTPRTVKSNRMLLFNQYIT